MTLPKEISLENIVKNPEIGLEIFYIEGEDAKVDRSRYLPIPIIVLEQHFNKQMYTNPRAAKIIIPNEFVFLYNTSTDERILMPTKNYNALVGINAQSEDGKLAKRFLGYFDGIEKIDLELIQGRYIMQGTPIAYRPFSIWTTFIAKNEPYINMYTPTHHVRRKAV